MTILEIVLACGMAFGGGAGGSGPYAHIRGAAGSQESGLSATSVSTLRGQRFLGRQAEASLRPLSVSTAG